MQTSTPTAPEPTVQDIQREAAAYSKEQDQGQRVQLIVFRLGSEEYALNIDQIKEVVLTPRIARVPQTPDYIRGIANIRGNIIAIIDLEQKFGLKAEAAAPLDSEDNYTLVIESEAWKVGILVNEVPNTLTVSTNQIDLDSGVLQFSALDAQAVRGIVKLDDRMIILVDMHELIQSENMGQLSLRPNHPNNTNPQNNTQP